MVATARAAADSIVVSLHDVAPCTQQITSTIISELSAHGVRVCSVLVVPDYHHEGLFAKHREFVTWLRALEADGARSRHSRLFSRTPVVRPKRLLRDKFMTRFYTQNEGEFYDLGYEEALRRITTARDEFRALGLNPRGFIAPAWLLGNEAGRPFVMRNWNTRHACAAYAISAPNPSFRRERSFTVFTIIGGARSVAVGTRHCSVY